MLFHVDSRVFSILSHAGPVVHAATPASGAAQTKLWSSLLAVAGLWLAVSFALWAVYRLIRLRDNHRQLRLLDGAAALIGEGSGVLFSIRHAAEAARLRNPYRGGASGQAAEDLRQDVRVLLDAIEAHSVFFDRTAAANKKIQRNFGLASFSPLSELLQIRRDFWAASEVFLMEDIEMLGVELADASALEAFRGEAKALLFGLPQAAEEDAVALRLAIAKEDAARFRAEVETAIAQDRDKNRLPRPTEIVAVPMRAAQLLAQGAREAVYAIGDFTAAVQGLARAISSRGLKGAAEELRRARSDLPSEFATAFDRAGGAARKGGLNLKRHYEFLLEAQELRARYAELLAKAPNLSEKGRQFVQRLEIERRAEQMRETSEGALAWFRQRLVVGIAYTIAALQHVQAKITPLENKQLVPAGTAGAFAAAAPAPRFEASPLPPLRTLLPPAAAFHPGGPSGRGGRRRGPEKPANGGPGVRFPITGEAAQPRYKASAPELDAAAKRMKARGGRATLTDRLSAIDETDVELNASAPEPPHEKTAVAAKAASKHSRFSLFKAKR